MKLLLSGRAEIDNYVTGGHGYDYFILIFQKSLIFGGRAVERNKHGYVRLLCRGSILMIPCHVLATTAPLHAMRTISPVYDCENIKKCPKTGSINSFGRDNKPWWDRQRLGLPGCVTSLELQTTTKCHGHTSRAALHVHARVSLGDSLRKTYGLTRGTYAHEG